MSEVECRDKHSRLRAKIYFDAQAAREVMDLPYDDARRAIVQAREESQARYRSGRMMERFYDEVDPQVFRRLVGLWSAERILAQRTPEVWRRRLRDIHAGDVQKRVACIVWWDYIAETEDASREFWARRIFGPPVPVSEGRTIKAMRRIGFCRYHAEKRLAGHVGL